MISVVLVAIALQISGSYAGACNSIADCGLFEACVNRMCVPDNMGCPMPCPAGQVCVPPNCVAAPAPQPVTTTTGSTTTTGVTTTTAAAGRCNSNAECGAFEVCVNGRCEPNNAGCNPPCAANQVCVAPNCVPAPVPPAQPTTPAATTTRAPPSCPPSWSPFSGHCYYVAVGSFIFNQASDWCTQTNSRPVWFDQSTVGTFGAELYFVNVLAASRGVQTYWLGLNKQFGQWVWTNGSPMIFSNWRANEPDGCCFTNVTCTLVNYANPYGQWDDAGCGNVWRNPQGFICKKPLA
uniref:C-type lectin-4 n=1 Tax=Toxocara cati TaxID=6266 RepID=A0A3S8Q0U7_TOXCT|nr:C-type lectin-4 [Toxocara cati]